MATSSGKSKILVDGNCIVCDWEIAHYKKIAPADFEIIDISDPRFDAQALGLTAEAVNKHMHVIDPEGNVHKGVEAFAHIWSRVPRYQWAHKIIHWPVVNPAAKVGYEVFARVRPYLPKKKQFPV